MNRHGIARNKRLSSHTRHRVQKVKNIAAALLVLKRDKLSKKIIYIVSFKKKQNIQNTRNI